MHRRRLAALVAAVLAASGPASGIEVTVSSAPVTRFNMVGPGESTGKLIFRGGIVMVSQDDTFGGLSGVTPTGPDQKVSFVSDRGNFVSGQLAYDDDGHLFGFIGAQIEPMQNSKGQPLPRQYTKDAESVDTVYRDGQPVAVRVSFENLTRVADFALSDSRPGGAAREISIPQWISDLRTNESLESLCIAPPASPIAGSTLLITEEALDEAGNHRGWLLGQNDKGPVSFQASPVVNPTDCAFLPNGDLLVLERGVSMLAFTMALRRVPADQVRPGNLMVGETLLEASGGSIDNMESLAVHTAPNGEVRILIGSDNNFNDWQRNMLLEFALPD